jgi:hypothetical protein
MRKKITIVLVIVAALVVYEFRNELMFEFQYYRLQGLSCQEAEKEGFVADSCLNKIWAHRVNSIERFKKIENKFFGYEVDVVWNRNAKEFLVYHPPLKDTPVSLDHFLAEVSTHMPTFWLDVREVAAADTSEVRKAFERLDKTGSFKLEVIVEVYDTTVASFLANHGYWVALNIKTEWIQQFSRESQWAQLRNVMSPRISFVSQEDIHVPLLKKHFPGKDIITWSLAFDNYFDRKHLKALISDERVKVILVNVKSRHYK